MWGRRHVCLVLHVVGCSKPPCLSRSEAHLHLCPEPTWAQVWSEHMFSIQDKNNWRAIQVPQRWKERSEHNWCWDAYSLVYSVLWSTSARVSQHINHLCLFCAWSPRICDMWMDQAMSTNLVLVRMKRTDHSNKLRTLTASFHRRTGEHGSDIDLLQYVWKCWSEIKLGNQTKLSEFQFVHNGFLFVCLFGFTVCTVAQVLLNEEV